MIDKNKYICDRKKIIYMKHLKKFNESNYMDEYRANNARIEAEHAEKLKQEREKFLEENPQHKGLTPKESRAKLDQERREKTESDHSLQFRLAVRAASKNADPEAHQKMIDLLKEHGVKLIKDRRYIALKWAAELGKEEVMDVLLDALEEAGEPNMDELKRNLEEYVRSGRG